MDARREWFRRLRRGVVAAVPVTAVVLAAGVLVPGRAAASIQADPSAGCTATLNGQSTSQPYTTANAIHVAQNSAATVTMQLSSPVHRRQVFLSFGLGPKLAVSDETDPTSTSTTVSVDKYATYGVGLYSVDAIATTADGTTCEVLQYVQVDGNPLATIAGAVSAALVALGALGIVLAALRALNPARVGPTWRPRFSVLGIIAGLIGGAALVVLLQQFSVMFPSYVELGVTVIVGIVLGILLPSLTSMVGAGRAVRAAAGGPPRAL